MKDRTTVKPYEEQNIKIYAYSLPSVPDHEGCIKVGETVRDVEKRLKEQLATAGLIPNIHFTKKAQKSNGEWFHDKDLHKYFILNNIQKRDFGTGADEWFYFNGNPEKAEELTDKFIAMDYDSIHNEERNYEYRLRKEQIEAVAKTLEYYKLKEKSPEFLWNAKPRFGKTLTAYDFIRKIKGKQVLIVTNRPAIANSWFEDFKKFIAWQEPKIKFVSDSSALKGKVLTSKEYKELLNKNSNQEYSCIYFISLQDLKGAKIFGGKHKKYSWISEVFWNLLIIDEAHEGVDTYRTDNAFKKIKREFTLHLSGTPFKAIASQKFEENQIYNWSYIDEQESKKNWNELLGSNPYDNLPVLHLFTYQMSKLIEDKAKKGKILENESNVDFSFDLNEFFRVENEKLVYENDVERFLDNLSSNKFPFSLDKHRNELNHTLWLLNRVDSVKALEKLLKKHPVFKNYKIVIAAGDGISSEEESKTQEKSLDKVRKAIKENERTITLSVGQLTTGVTVPEWTGVLILSNIKSPSLYFQAAFRCQNPYEYKDNLTGVLLKKENAYVFDFAPERTLRLYDEYANNLILLKSNSTKKNNIDGIRKLLNFLPIIAEDENGNLKEISAEEVLLIPSKIKSQEVVKRGFMSNLLFENISAIFNAPKYFKDILDKLSPEKKGKSLKHSGKVNYTNQHVDNKNNVSVPNKIIIAKNCEIFGQKLYSNSFQNNYRKITSIIEYADEEKNKDIESLVNDISNKLTDGFDNLKNEFKLNNKQKNILVEGFKRGLTKIVEKEMQEKIFIIEELKNEYMLNESKAHTIEKEEIRKKIEGKILKIESDYQEKITEVIKVSTEGIVRDQLKRVEEIKKKTTEDEIRDRLRGFSRTIPAFLMAYGNPNTTLKNFENNIDPDVFLEITSITIDEFKKLRDGFSYKTEEDEEVIIHGLFDEVVFNNSIKEFFLTKERLVNYFENDEAEDIFDYIPAQKTNQIFTPKSVVNWMLDTLEENNPNIFKDKNKKFLDLYVKSGLYLSEIAKRLFKGLEDSIPFEEERIKWIFEKQLYGFAPSNIIFNIARNFIYGEFDYIKKINLFELDMVPIVEKKYLKQKIKEVWGDSMKFDVIIGNPPYQEKGGSGGNNDSPLYQFFIEESYKLDAKYLSFIIPSRWFSAGRDNLLGNFRKLMLTSKQVKEMTVFTDGDEVFKDVELKGGVCYFLLDKNYSGECKYKLDNKEEYYRKLDDFDILIRDNIVSDIVKKVNADNQMSLSEIISNDTPFGIPSNPRTSKKNPFSVYSDNSIYDTKLFHIEKNKRKIEYINRDEVIKNSDYIDKWKVFIPGSAGSGNDEIVLGRPEIAEPNSVCSQSYLFTSHSSKEEAENLFKYVQTKFLRILVSAIKITQSAPKKVYRFVPIQDFTKNSDIDWNKSIPEINLQLCKKYNLTEDEIKYIDLQLKEM